MKIGSPLDAQDAVLPAADLRGTPVRLALRRVRQEPGQGVRRGGRRAGHLPGHARRRGLDLGYDFGTWGELRVGYRAAYGKARRKVGDPTFPDVDWDEGGFTASMAIDQLDNVNLPHAGYLGVVDYFGNRTSLGGTDSYDRFQAGLLGVKTIGRWTGLAKVDGGTGFQSVIPFYDDFQLGGLFRLSGRPAGQLTGPNYGLVALLLYYRLTASRAA